MLKEDAGLPRRLLYTLAVISGVSVANLYYNQPLLDMIRQDLGISTLAANHIALYSQAGYALGLLFLIPLADLVSRRRILLAVFALLILSLAATSGRSTVSRSSSASARSSRSSSSRSRPNTPAPRRKTATWASSSRDFSRESSPRAW